MELRQLQYLLEVAEAGSINRAADRLGIAQSAVSRRLAGLESDLGAILLRRSPEGVALTPAGTQAVATAQAVLREIDGLRRALAEGEPALQRVRLGVPPTVSGVFRQVFESPVRQGAMQIHPSVVEASSYWLARRLAAGDLDCAVVTHLETPADWRVEPLWVESLCLVGPAGSPLAGRKRCSVAAIVGLPLTLTPLPDNSRRVIEQAFQEQGCTPLVAQEHEALNLLKGQVRHGAHSILPRLQARELAREGCFCVPVDGLSIRRAFVYRRGELAAPVARMMLAAMREHAGRVLPEDGGFRLGWQ